MKDQNITGLPDLLQGLQDTLEGLSSTELEKLLNQLHNAHTKARIREKKEKEQEERKAAQEKARKEREERDEHIREVTSMELPLTWESAFAGDERTAGVHTESVSDALVMCLTALGRVDIEYISSVTGADPKTVIGTLKGSIFQNPLTWGECFYKGWETADEYLSGNLMRKRREAENANKTYKGYFSDNVRAIDAVLPPAVATEDIYVTLGSPWVPADVIDDFIVHLFGDPFNSNGLGWYSDENQQKLREGWKTRRDELTGTWEIPGKSRYGAYHTGVTVGYGTKKVGALAILEKTLNLRSLHVKDAGGGIDRLRTMELQEKRKKLVEEFKAWIWKDPARKERLEIIYENNFSCVRRRIFNGSFLTFPGLSPAVTLYPYQKNAVARILFSPNTLLAHDVGAGKTYVMIAAGMELKRMGLSKKNLYVVPNSIVGQWEKIFHTLYPDAKVLVADPKSFSPKKRSALLERIRDEDWDGIIMAYSCFEMIPLSRKFYEDELEKKKDLLQIMATGGKVTGSIKKNLDQVNTALSLLAMTLEEAYDTVYFDELGIERLFVDEAHNFKNVPIKTKMRNIAGISATGSEKCRDMMDKVHAVQRANGGKGVIFATGTPVTNSVTDAFIMQQYLQEGELAVLGLQNFDSWVGMFAEPDEEFEVDVDTSLFRMRTRFAHFHNLPELSSLLAGIADFHKVEEKGLPLFNGYRDVEITPSADLKKYLSGISRRVEDIRMKNVRAHEDNMLKVTTDGRKAALDLRLVEPGAARTDRSKTSRCAEIAADIYFQTQKEKSTQLIFCDVSTPKDAFNIYDEMKKLLTGWNVPAGEIAFIHDSESREKRAELFRKVNAGEIRILIGSTFKLGLGVNVQERLVALHHLDVPWRPSDMVQREGRILRQGNTSPEVFIYRYITKESFDAYSWQLLETKQRFISELLSGDLSDRDGKDLEDVVLDYGEVKALAIGNPLIRERVEIANELTRFRLLQRSLIEERMRMEAELKSLPGEIARLRDLIPLCRDDAEFAAKSAVPDPKKRTPEELEQRLHIREDLDRALRGNVLSARETEWGEYRGFRVLLPANMVEKKPWLRLARKGTWFVELGGTEKGNLIRMDNVLDSLFTRLKRIEEELKTAETRAEHLREELKKGDSFAEKVTYYKKKLEQIDQQLGVKK